MLYLELENCEGSTSASFGMSFMTHFWAKMISIRTFQIALAWIIGLYLLSIA